MMQRSVCVCVCVYVCVWGGGGTSQIVWYAMHDRLVAVKTHVRLKPEVGGAARPAKGGRSKDEA